MRQTEKQIDKETNRIKFFEKLKAGITIICHIREIVMDKYLMMS
jgi:hypothetical protein